MLALAHVRSHVVHTQVEGLRVQSRGGTAYSSVTLPWPLTSNYVFTSLCRGSTALVITANYGVC